MDPRISLYAGSQYFYQEYYSSSRLGNRKGKEKGPWKQSQPPATVVEIKEASEFNFLNLELSLPAAILSQAIYFFSYPSMDLSSEQCHYYHRGYHY